jgi:hypothetical protein
MGVGVEIVLGGMTVLVVAVVLLYNRLIRSKVRVRQAWAQVDAQLQRLPGAAGRALGHRGPDLIRPWLPTTGYPGTAS